MAKKGAYSGNVSNKGNHPKGNMSAGNVKGSRLNEGGDMKHKGTRKGC